MGQGQSQAAPEFSWAVEMPLLTNRFFLYDGLKLFAWLIVILSVIMLVAFALAGSLRNLLPIMELFAAVTAGILFLFFLIAWLFFGNRFPMGFRIAPDGIAWVSLSRRARIANRVAVVAGVASGRLGGVGAGMLAISQESGNLSWEKLRTVKYYPGERVITLMNSWRVVIRLYCTPENYSYVSQLVNWYFVATRPQPGALAGIRK